MFRQLVSHNADLGRLVEKGYAVAFDTNCLIVRDVPYLDGDGALQCGAIVAKLVFVDRESVRQDDHQILFAGGVPYGLDGKPIPNLGGGEVRFPLSPACADVVVQRSFSNKPRDTGAFPDFFAKVESYVHIISGPAMARYAVSPLTYRADQTVVSDSVFKFHDTMTSRAGIVDLSSRFADDVVALIGLGGTGSYLLDFIVKTPVKEIRGFDHDGYYVHNAFRSPGRLEEAELGRSKAEVYQGRYETFRCGLSIKQKFIDASCSEELDGVTFAFVCVDKGSARAGIVDLLLSRGIPFIDVGMGLKRKPDGLNGMIRVTYFSPDGGAALREAGLVELVDRPDDLYHDNIQISELNALNASLAVLRFKQIRGFYSDARKFDHFILDVGDVAIRGLPDDDAV